MACRYAARVRTDWRGKVVGGCLKTGHQELFYRVWRYHMLHVYNYVLLKMSTWCSKHVDENSILWINNNQCIKLVINVYVVTSIRHSLRNNNYKFRDYWLLSWCKWDLRPSGMLCSVDWYLPTFRENYRVSIKSFPDHKHLLQENYVEYTFFFQNVTQLKKFFRN